jgi:hypothetical protein
VKILTNAAENSVPMVNVEQGVCVRIHWGPTVVLVNLVTPEIRESLVLTSMSVVTPLDQMESVDTLQSVPTLQGPSHVDVLQGHQEIPSLSVSSNTLVIRMTPALEMLSVDLGSVTVPHLTLERIASVSYS